MSENLKALTKFRANAPEVVAEIIDGEAVLVHMGNGRYYSLQDSGAAVWVLLAAGMSEEQVVEKLAAHFGASVEVVRSEVNELRGRLVTESLLVKEEGGSEDCVEMDVSEEFGTEWQSPDLQVYDDMEDLLLVDPIHEVTDAGWPNTK